jgi:hypothetical protein
MYGCSQGVGHCAICNANCSIGEDTSCDVPAALVIACKVNNAEVTFTLLIGIYCSQDFLKETNAQTKLILKTFPNI